MKPKYILAVIIALSLLLVSCAKDNKNQNSESVYDSLKSFPNIEELLAYIRGNDEMKKLIMQAKDTEIPQLVTPAEAPFGMELREAYIHGSNIYYCYYYPNYKPEKENYTEEDEIKEFQNHISIQWLFPTFGDEAREGLERFTNANAPIIKPVQGFENMYYSDSDYPVTNPPYCKMFYWIQDDYSLYATVPTELADKFLQNLKENGSNFLKLIDIN